jgi:arylsulfatase A-like enzyme
MNIVMRFWEPILSKCIRNAFVYFVVLNSVASGKPNVVLVLTDDQGCSDVGFNGNPIVKTPILDKFATSATIFERFYADPVCSPTRAALMTGRSAFRTGVLETQAGVSILRPSETTMAEALKSAGYRTGLFGKWHLGDNAPARPMDQGFDRSLTFTGGMIGAPYSPLAGQSYFDPILIEDGVEKRFAGYCTDIFTDAAVEFVQTSEDTPFFVYLAFNTPHHPLTVSDRYAQPYRDMGLSEDTSRYYGMISNIDDNFGRLMDALKVKGVADNTVIIFLSDNGTSSLHKQNDLWESGLRGRKTYVYENGIRVPMFIKVPGCSADRVKEPASVEDIMPTILDICQVPVSSKMDGLSLLTLLGGNPPRPSATPPKEGNLLQSSDPLRGGVREARGGFPSNLSDRSFFFQFHRGSPPDRYRNAAGISKHWKLVQPVGRGGGPFSPDAARFELYDLKHDPNETNNLVAEKPETVATLKAEYDAWFTDVCSGGFEPVRTWIGSDVQNPVVLTRQDWIGGGLFDGDLGHYELDVKSAGTYRITCRWSELLKEEHPVVLKIDNRVFKNKILYAESECRFESVKLPVGPCRFEARIEIDGKPCGFRFVEIEKL